MSIREFTIEELENELNRRQSIKESVWPKQFNLVLEYDIADDAGLVEFLEDKCDFIEGSEEFETANKSLKSIHLECQIYKDGSIEVVNVNGNADDNIHLSTDKCTEVK